MIPVTAKEVVVAWVVVLLVMLLKIFAPEKVLLSDRRVDDDTPDIVPQVTLPPETFRALDPVQLPVAMNRLVVLAVVENIVVVVALVVVELRPVKF